MGLLFGIVPYPVAALFAAFVISAVSGLFIIPWLKRLKFGQVIREEGLESHYSKAGTTIMGGLMFLLSTLVVCGIAAVFYPRLLLLLFVTMGCGFIGFLDDWLKVAKKHNEGLKASQKMVGLVLVAILFTVGVLLFEPHILRLYLPFAGNAAFWTMPIVVAAVLSFAVILSAANAVNLTDGVDGLSGSVTLVVLVFFSIAAYVDPALAHTRLFSAVVAGGILGFLLYNLHPAKVFMGDTGSLALGGAVGGLAVVSGMSLLFVIAGIVYVLETLSVMIQVGVYKKTKKRVFKMAPIHHHFEKSGWGENKIVVVFTAVAICASVIALLGLR